VYRRDLHAVMMEREMRPARVTHAGAADAIGPAQSSSHFESSIESVVAAGCGPDFLSCIWHVYHLSYMAQVWLRVTDNYRDANRVAASLDA
jgi:CO dehydrogenase/acetyl-CoA synthase beta subunit